MKSVAETANDSVSASARSGMRRIRLVVYGRVQGVGFRPAVYRAVTGAGCGGRVYNTPGGVSVEIEGPQRAVTRLTGHFADILPPRARVDEIVTEELDPAGEKEFHIDVSSTAGESLLPIPPDLAICSECAGEITDRRGRRRGYGFNTCTCCGPRFTIADGVPFDRRTSVMEDFPLCEKCLGEFGDPADRRFHAQTMSCPSCGPEAQFIPIARGRDKGVEFAPSAGDEAICAAAAALKAGRTVAIKGIGGFHLACNAADDAVIQRIRTLKGRPHKALAVMVRDLSTAARICRMEPGAGDMLRGEKAPIVLLEKKDTPLISGSVAPGLGRVGVMPAYTPLHRLLFEHPDTPEALVMTSCNRSEEPIAIDRETVRTDLSDMVDGILDHNRRIENRCDDSVAGMVGGAAVVFRRSRGYAPEPVMLPADSPPVFATGAMWKNAFTLTKGRRAFMSPHIGDVSDADNAAYFEAAYRKFSVLLGIEPEILACDMHPDYPTSVFARRMAQGRDLPLHRVQHHYAHVLSCLAEHRAQGPVIGVSMDGTGYGEDGHIWGGEILVAGLQGYSRRFHLKYAPMPGGERAVSEPYRMALSHLAGVFGADDAVAIMGRIAPGLPLEAVASLAWRREFSPLTSSCGRLFDAVASMLGIRHISTYEGQAACELEAVAAAGVKGGYEYGFEGDEIVFPGTIAGICEDIAAGADRCVISARFHNTIAGMIEESCLMLRESDGLDTVALSGGVMQNTYLLGRCLKRLRRHDFTVLVHGEVPPNDGGISLGQALYVNARHTS